MATMEDHTHAFDSFTRLANVSGAEAGPAWVVREVAESIQKHEASGTAELIGLAILGVMIVAGLSLRTLGDRVRVEHLLQQREEKEDLTSPAWDPALTPRQLVASGVVAVLAFAAVGLYVFYPSVDDLVDEMNVIRAEAYDAVRSDDVTEFMRRANQWKRQAEKLPTSLMIRGGSVSESGRESLDKFIYALNTMEEHINSGRVTEARMMRMYVERLYRDCCEEFRNTNERQFAAGTM